MGHGVEILDCPHRPPPCAPSHSSWDLPVENTLLGAQSDLQAPTLTQDAEGGCKSLYTGQFAGPAIVHRVGGHEVRQQTKVASPHLPKWCLMQSGPGTVDDSHSRLCNQLSARSSIGLGSGGQQHLDDGPRAGMSLESVASLGIQGQHSPAPNNPRGQAFEAAGERGCFWNRLIDSLNKRLFETLYPGLCSRRWEQTRQVQIGEP